jgi:hypothetical protein
MSRRERQLNELRHLCCTGAVARAIDLAFEHFACFGPDDEIIDLITHAIGRVECGGRARQRLTELRTSKVAGRPQIA